MMCREWWALFHSASVDMLADRRGDAMGEPDTTERSGTSSATGRRRRYLVLAAVVVVLLAVGVVVATTDSGGLLGARPRDAAATAPRPPAPPQYVSRNGSQLAVDGKPFRFVGFNSYVMLGCGDPDEKISGDARDAFFGSLRPGGVVRVSMLPGTSTADTDAVVASAAKYGQRLIVALSDQYGDCGDIKKDDAFYAGGYRGAFLDWVRTIVPRYRDSPTIAMWELANEPKSRDVAALRAFFDDAGGLVHELDPNHLLSSGTALPDGLGGRDGFLQLMSSPAIDVVSMHEYDAVSDVSPHLDDVLDVAEKVDKPVLVGEWGLYASSSGTQGDSGAKCFDVPGRASVGREKLTAYLAVPQVAGLLYWSYTADGIQPSDTQCSYNTTQGDPLVSVINNVGIPPSQG
jgi:mannan endo-1,4-beta-mannosidase